ncbi:hypothetical protein GCM10011375_36870 [Hymenobacter qilianensis]|uniref:Uncharacterized protein n=2 Tax=Hymenobacter qilianensis TaxID=1385715 RepID=A0ACB5PWA5_9BACT|nr:DUF1572 family protein [Hymenobacter qilianensis]QNP51098.1 DUF1572 family protein [Hymenobacter qilianensis]GGF78400.1 hypothetical protein GCM10011375_36870 [Hymenobacter qilianensis]
MSLPPNDALGQAVLANLRHTFVQYKTLADRALAQIQPAEWLYNPAPGANSAAVIVQHMVGNLRSRFTDFLTTDGEKPDRRRDQEFEEPNAPAETYVPALREQWEAAWRILFDLLNTLQPDDLLSTVTIRGEAHTALAALERQVAHYSYHVGQLVQLGKLLRGADWQNLSVPRGQSENFTQQVQQRANPKPSSIV